MSKENKDLKSEAADMKKKDAEKLAAETHFKIKLKKVPEIAEEKEFGDKIPLEEDSGEKAPDSNNPSSDDEHVGEAHEKDPGIAGNAGQRDPNEPKNDHKIY